MSGANQPTGLKAMIQEAVKEGLKEALGDHPCRYTSLNPQQLDHVVGMLTDIGDGDLRRGIEVVRVNHKWVMDRADEERDAEYTANHELVSAIRKGLSNVGGYIAKGIAWALIAGLATLVWLGFKTKLFQ